MLLLVKHDGCCEDDCRIEVVVEASPSEVVVGRREAVGSRGQWASSCVGGKRNSRNAQRQTEKNLKLDDKKVLDGC